MDQLARWLHTAVRGCAAGLTLALVACAIQGGDISPGAGVSSSAELAPPAERKSDAAVKVALLVPLSASGQTAAVAKAMKQAAEMALFEHDNAAVQLIAKDDKGTPDGARAAAEEALREGAELIVGPLFAKSVQAITPLAREARVPVLAFSNDRQVAGPGVYILGFLPQQEVQRVVTYAVGQGRKRFAALLPDDAYGKLLEAAFRDAVANANGTIAALESYEAQSNRMVEPAQRIATAIRSADDAHQPVDAFFVPGGPETLPTLGPLLAYASIDTDKVKLLGTGGWDYPSLGREAVFVGGWYPAADPRGWREFSERFAKTFGSSPPRIASMAYDAVSIAVTLSGEAAGQRFSAANLTRADGFNGVDGPLRLMSSGLTQRALAILETHKFGTKVVDPPSSGFTASDATSGNTFN
jgi:ABC-type branched-subunit amino acid transport system substrate-binding protein